MIVDVFKPALLAAYTGRDASEGMAALQKAAIAKRPAGMGILEYGRQIGMTQQQKNGGIAPPPAPCTNLIYYGPLGTGKTHKLNEILEHEYAQTNVSPEEWCNRFIADKAVELTLLGLGFRREDFTRQTSEFSGGWHMHIELAKLLLQRPDVLLLDEPTNHLDIESIQWLEDFLVESNQTVVVISHDRAFVDRITTRTIEITGGRIYDYEIGRASCRERV